MDCVYIATPPSNVLALHRCLRINLCSLSRTHTHTLSLPRMARQAEMNPPIMQFVKSVLLKNTTFQAHWKVHVCRKMYHEVLVVLSARHPMYMYYITSHQHCNVTSGFIIIDMNF